MGFASSASRRSPRSCANHESATIARREPHRRRREAGPEPRRAARGPSSRSTIDRARRLVERRHRQATVLEHLDEHAARPHQHQRPELRIAHDPERDLDPRRRHRGDRDLRTEPAFEIRVRVLERRRVVDAEPHAADVRLVLHARAPPSSARPGTRSARPPRSRPRASRRERSRPPARRSRRAARAPRARRTAPRSRAARSSARAPRRVTGDTPADRLARAEVPVREQVPERGEPRQRPLEHRDPVAVEQLRVAPVDAAREVREHREGLVGLGEGLARHRDVPHLRVVLRGQVDRRTRARRRPGPRAARGRTR